MSTTAESNSSYLPRVLIIGDYSQLILDLIKKFEEENVNVCVFTNDVVLRKNTGVNFVNDNEIDVGAKYNNRYFNYVVCLLVGKKYDTTYIKYLNTAASIIGAKTLFVFSFSLLRENASNHENIVGSLIENKKLNPGIIFSGELLDEPSHTDVGSVRKIIKSAVRKRSVKIVNEEKYHYPLTTSALIGQIFYNLFSFGSFGKKIAIVSKPIKEGEIVRNIKGRIPGVAVKKIAEKHVYAGVDEKTYVDIDVQKFLNLLLEDAHNLKKKNNGKSLLSTPALQRSKQKKVSGSVNTPPQPEAKNDKLINNIGGSGLLVGQSKLAGNIAYKHSAHPLRNESVRSGIYVDPFMFAQQSPDGSSVKATEPGKLKKTAWRNKMKLPRSYDRGTLRRGIKKGYLYAIPVAVFILILIPILTLLMSFSTLNFADRALKNRNISWLKNFAKASYVLSTISNKYYTFYNDAPFVGNVSKPLFVLSGFAQKSSVVFWESANVFDKVEKIITNATNTGSYDIESESRELAISLDSLYKNLGFIKGDATNSKLIGKLINMNRIFEDDSTRQMLIPAKEFAHRLPEMLGKGRPTTYLVLFQNDLVAKPSGGDIQALGLFTFSNGSLINQSIIGSENDSGEFLGIVDPPDAIRMYFGKDAWELKDANWYSDFPTSAEKIVWFADKQMDLKVDGVIAVNVYNNLNVLGISVSKDDVFYESAVESDKNLLSSFMSEALQLAMNKNTNLFPLLMSSGYNKNLLIYFQDKELQNTVNNLGVGGRIGNTTCNIENCFIDKVGVVENQINTSPVQVERLAEVSITLDEGVIKRNLMFFIDNSKNRAYYETYIKVVANDNVGFSPVVVVSASSRDQKYPEIYSAGGYKEAGIYLKIEAGESKALMFSWEGVSTLDMGENGRYELIWYKQPGVFPFEIRTDMQFAGVHDIRKSNLFLTESGGLTYNTTLLKDSVYYLEW